MESPSQSTAQTTLLVFTLGPRAESSRRRFLPRALGNWEHSFHRRCLREALAAGRESHCRLAVSSPTTLGLPEDTRPLRQIGNGFGARFSEAIQRISAEGTPLIVVGTDTPALTAQHIRQTKTLLAENPDRVVLGPSRDGGFYLLAFARPLQAELEGVQWCRSGTLASLLRALENASRPVSLLSPLEDLDRPADFLRWLARGTLQSWRRWTRVLSQELAALCRPPVTIHEPLLSAPPLSRARGRAPPTR